MKKWLLTILLALLLLLLSGCKPETPEPSQKVIVKNLAINKIEENKHVLSFIIQNLNTSVADCYIKVFTENQLMLIKGIGIIKAKTEEKKEIKITLNDSKADIKMEHACRWIDEDTAKTCTQPTYPERRICELTLNKPELKQCLGTNMTYYQFFCIALLTKNPDICNEITSAAKKIWCKAYITKDPDLCQNIIDPNGKDLCYSDLGMNFRDQNICTKINDAKTRTSCTAVVTQQPNMCLEGSADLRLTCIINLIETTGKKDLCNLLDGPQKEECLTQIR